MKLSKKMEMPEMPSSESSESEFDVMSEEPLPMEESEDMSAMQDYSDEELLAAVDEAQKRGLLEASPAEEESAPAEEAMSDDEEESESEPMPLAGLD